jgi:regulatory protein
MDTERHEGDSSSRNDRVILRIKQGGAVGEVAKIDFSDGSSFSVPTSTLLDERLSVDSVLTEERYEALLAVAAAFETRRTALRMLASSEQTRRRLELKLVHRGFEQDVVRRVLDSLEARGELDDRRFAEQWLSSRRRRSPEGKPKLLAGLLSQGVARETAESVLAAMSAEEEAEALKRAAARLAAGSRTNPQKLLRSLLAKGFSYRDAKQEVFRLLPDQSEKHLHIDLDDEGR